MFIQTEATPATLKVLPGRVVMEEGTFEARGVARLPLARPPRRTCRDARRSTTFRSARSGDGTFDCIHDALIVKWPR